MLADLPVRRALLLQGPNGPFFRRLADFLQGRGVEVTKVNFNAGDAFFFRGPEVISYRGKMEAWGPELRSIISERAIDGVFLFGDCRPMHRESIEIADELGIPVWVFEEGYLRPDYVTVEEGGVNGNSSVPKEPELYRAAAAEYPDMPPPQQVGNTFYHHAFWAIVHSLALTLGSFRYPNYRHHRDVNSLRQCAYWLRGTMRKGWYSVTERDIMELVTGEWSRAFYLVPLQVHCDAQFHHARFASSEEFISEVVQAFVEHANPEHRLLLKHHPHDRAYRDYTRFIRELGERHGCAERLVYIHDLHLPTILKHARGVITMNSTVGTSALHHGTPVKVLGRAVYDIPGLTFQGSLAEFFAAPGVVDRELYQGFCAWLRAHNQINGSFYRVLDRSNPTGLVLRDAALQAATEPPAETVDALEAAPTPGVREPIPRP